VAGLNPSRRVALVTETETEVSTEQGGINRRQALKRIAAGGALLWTIPAVQTLNMRHALALGSPGEDCYTIKLEGDDCETPSPNANLANAFRCLYSFDPDFIVTDQPTAEACSKVVNFTHNAPSWFVTLAPGCHLEAGFSKCGSRGEFCTASPSPEGSTGTIQFVPCGNGAGISHIEFTICCDPVP
jgi:hypothetical protein